MLLLLWQVREYFIEVLGFFKKALDGWIEQVRWLAHCELADLTLNVQKDLWQREPNLAGKRVSQVRCSLGCSAASHRRCNRLFTVQAVWPRSSCSRTPKSAARRCDSNTLTRYAALARIADVLGKMTESVVTAYKMMPQHDLVRAKTIVFLHRMIDFLGGLKACAELTPLANVARVSAFTEGLVPYLSVLEPMIQTTNPGNVIKLMELLIQLCKNIRVRVGGGDSAC